MSAPPQGEPPDTICVFVRSLRMTVVEAKAAASAMGARIVAVRETAPIRLPAMKPGMWIIDADDAKQFGRLIEVVMPPPKGCADFPGYCHECDADHTFAQSLALAVAECQGSPMPTYPEYGTESDFDVCGFVDEELALLRTLGDGER